MVPLLIPPIPTKQIIDNLVTCRIRRSRWTENFTSHTRGRIYIFLMHVCHDFARARPENKCDDGTSKETIFKVTMICRRDRMCSRKSLTCTRRVSHVFPLGIARGISPPCTWTRLRECRSLSAGHITRTLENILVVPHPDGSWQWIPNDCPLRLDFCGFLLFSTTAFFHHFNLKKTHLLHLHRKFMIERIPMRQTYSGAVYFVGLTLG